MEKGIIQIPAIDAINHGPEIKNYFAQFGECEQEFRTVIRNTSNTSDVQIAAYHPDIKPAVAYGDIPVYKAHFHKLNGLLECDPLIAVDK